MNDHELRAELEKHYRESYGWAMSLCLRDQAEAENVLQTVYVKVLEGKARFDGRASFRTWLFAVIRITAIDERRRLWLRRLRTDSYEKQIANKVGERDPEASAYHSELRELFQRVLAELPRRQREVLQLAFYHDLSLAEASEVMGVSLGSARTHYERGKQRLRTLMKDLEIYESRRTENQEAI